MIYEGFSGRERCYEMGVGSLVFSTTEEADT